MPADADQLTASNLDAIDLHGNDFVDLMDEIRGEMQIAVDWIDGAFGEIEAEASKFAPIRALRAGMSRIFGN